MLNAITALDSPLFGPSFVDPDMREVFGASAYIDRIVEVEVALARAEAVLGLIPVEAADGIAAAAKTMVFDIDRLGRETTNVGYPILPIVRQMSAAAGEAGRYLHWGATTQDIMDTATVLQIRAGLDVVATRLDAVRSALGALAGTYRDTPMAGRTHLQHALPVTFGYKAAVWRAGLDRHAERLAQLRPRVEQVSFSGAAGTLASLDGRGLEVQAGLAGQLGLGVPPITWHSSRDGFAEAVGLLAMIGASLGKIAADISIMMMSELGEAAEPFADHRGASSTMPQKRNPISCELILAGARMLRQHQGLMLDAMLHDFERATGPWHLEWQAVPESFAVASGVLAQADFMLSGLQVFPEAMARNLGLSRGLIVAEAVMMALAPHTGRNEAHDLVYAGCREALETGVSLLDVLVGQAEVVGPLGRAALTRLTDPVNYLGEAGQMVDRVLGMGENGGQAEPGSGLN